MKFLKYLSIVCAVALIVLGIIMLITAGPAIEIIMGIAAGLIIITGAIVRKVQELT